jgi:hypothetical protein
MIPVCSEHGRGVERRSRVSRSKGEQPWTNVDTALERTHPSSALSLPLERQARQRKVHLKGGRKGANGVGPHVGFGGLRRAKAGRDGGMPRQWRPVGQPPVKSSMGHPCSEYAGRLASRHIRAGSGLSSRERLGQGLEELKGANNGRSGSGFQAEAGGWQPYLRSSPRGGTSELRDRENSNRQKLGLALAVREVGRA